MDDPNFVLSNNFLTVASRDNRHSSFNVSIWDFIAISLCFISATVISVAWPMLSFDLLRMFELSDKSICLYADAVFNSQWPHISNWSCYTFLTNSFMSAYKYSSTGQQIWYLSEMAWKGYQLNWKTGIWWQKIGHWQPVKFSKSSLRKVAYFSVNFPVPNNFDYQSKFLLAALQQMYPPPIMLHKRIRRIFLSLLLQHISYLLRCHIKLWILP